MYFGDATNIAVVEHAGVRDARAAAIVINDPAATRRIALCAVSILILHRRAHPLRHRSGAALASGGWGEVVPEEYETSLGCYLSPFVLSLSRSIVFRRY
jgi:CPA2 family monovalent cation:H+ antiporter-2